MQPETTLNGNAPGKRWLDYKVGGVDFGGIRIVKIVHRSERGAIYWIADDKGIAHNVKWDVDDDIGVHWARSTALTRRLLAPIKRVIRDSEDRDSALMMISAGLVRALEDDEPGLEQDYLIEAAEYINDRRKETLQIRYFLASVTTAVATTLSLFLVALLTESPVAVVNGVSSVRQFLVAALLGGLGALISVSQRFRSIEVERYMSRLLAVIGGASRIVFGCFFGAVFLLFQKAGLVLTVAGEQSWLLAAAALIAGFSERVIPEVLGRFEAQLTPRRAKDPKRVPKAR